jgi:hypothetical protein
MLRFAWLGTAQLFDYPCAYSCRSAAQGFFFSSQNQLYFSNELFLTGQTFDHGEDDNRRKQ